jgi:hypothetical protein
VHDRATVKNIANSGQTRFGIDAPQVNGVLSAMCSSQRRGVRSVWGSQRGRTRNVQYRARRVPIFARNFILLGRRSPGVMGTAPRALAWVHGAPPAHGDIRGVDPKCTNQVARFSECETWCATVLRLGSAQTKALFGFHGGDLIMFLIIHWIE